MPARPPSPPTPSPEEPPPKALPPRPVRWLLTALAALSLATGVVGIFVPGLPTTVFVLIAGWAAARSSPRLYRWLWNHRLFGPMLRNWAQGGCVSRKAKWSATVMMAACALIMVLASVPLWAIATAYTCMVTVLIWLWRRPEPPHRIASV